MRPALLTGLLALALYSVTAPMHVQEGDTGELVLAGWKLLVPHPPGYPLQVLWNWFTTHALPTTPYHAAALGTAFVGALGASLLTSLLGGWGGALAAGVWATSRLTWKWSVLPDVFAGLVAFQLLFLFLHRDSSRYRMRWWVGLMALSVLHHHAIIFMLPILLARAWEHRQEGRAHAWAIVCGTVALSGYGLLLAFDASSPGSWGNMDGWGDVLHHFLRSDYGTFRLSNHGAEADPWGNLGRLAQYVVENFWGPLVLAACAWRSFTRRHLLPLACLALYSYVLVARSNLGDTIVGVSTLERFFLFPSLLVTATLPRPGSRWGQAVLALNLIANLGLNWGPNDFRRDQRLESWLATAFQQTPNGATLLLTGDTTSYSARYLHWAEAWRPDLLIAGPLDESPIERAKLARLRPGAFRPGTELQVGFISAYDFAHSPLYGNTLEPRGGESLGKTIKGVVVEYSQNGGALELDCPPPRTYAPIDWSMDASRLDIPTMFALDYGRCDYLVGVAAFSRAELSGAEAAFRRSLALCPLCILPHERLCAALKAQSRTDSMCGSVLDAALENFNPGYLPAHARW